MPHAIVGKLDGQNSVYTSVVVVFNIHVIRGIIMSCVDNIIKEKEKK